MAAALLPPPPAVEARLFVFARRRRDPPPPPQLVERVASPHPLCLWLCLAIAAVLMSCGWIAAYMIPLHVLLRGNLPDSPARGVPLLLGCEVVNFLFILPIWPLQVLYGYLFGVVQGCLLAVCAYTISCLPPFFLAAPMLRALRGVALEKHGEVSESSTWLHWLWGKVCGWVARHDVVANIQDAVREQPFATTMALRLNLLPPAGLTSYALGACQIPSLAYALGSAIGNVPNATAYVYVGTLLTSIHDVLSGRVPSSPVSTALLTTGLMTSVALLLLLSRSAASRLALAAVQESQGERLA